MNKKAWIFFFFFVLAGDIIALQLANEPLQLIFKPLLMMVLGVYFVVRTGGIESSLKIWIMLAMFFSWAGDVFLLFQLNEPIFFLLGLSSFLVAHVFYIIFFNRVRLKETIPGNGLLLIPVIIYYAVLINFLSDFLGEMKIPVRVYGVVISFMLMLALHMLYLKNKTTGRLMMAGAVLFVISDTVLAINKFYQFFELAGLIIMFTYGLAQLFIVEGAARYISSASKQ